MPSKATPKILGHQWRVDTIWNQALESIPERPLVKRDYIWASELGGSMIDRYLKMNAHPMTNPPNARSKRKFSAGHIWEWILGFVLTSSGILKQKQLHGIVELPGLLKVTGKLDFVAGGVVDWEKARHDVEILRSLLSASISEMPPIVMHSIDKIISSFEKQYANNPLEEVVLEAKSMSSFMSEKLQKTNKPMDHNVLQNLHYVIANKMPGQLLYICKDDCITQQFRVEPKRELLKLYKEDVATMTGYIEAAGKKYIKNLPPKENELLFDESMYRFQSNFRVEYSSYLEMLYGYKTPELYRLKYKRSITAWNRVIKRYALGQPMTASNNSYIKEIERVFPEWEKYAIKAKKSGFFDKPEETEEEA
jgi:hypothetical protein